MKYWPLVWAGLWRKPVRTVLTMLSIVVAFALFGSLHGVSAALEFAVTQLEVGEILVMGHGFCGGCAAALKSWTAGAGR